MAQSWQKWALLAVPLPGAAWKGATCCFTTKITHYFTEAGAELSSWQRGHREQQCWGRRGSKGAAVPSGHLSPSGLTLSPRPPPALHPSMGWDNSMWCCPMSCSRHSAAHPTAWFLMGKGVCAVLQASRPKEFNGLSPCPTHTLHRLLQIPLRRAHSAPDPLTAPTIAGQIKIIEQQVHFPGQCCSRWNPMGLELGSARPQNPWAPKKHPQVLVLWGRRKHRCQLCAAARPPWRPTPIKRSSSCSQDNKTLFSFLF